MPDNPKEAHVVVDLPDTSKIVVVNSDDESMKGFEGHLEEEDDLKEDQEIDEVVEEQQMNHEVNEAVGEQQVDQEAGEVELGASDNSFDSGEELEDESNPDYDPSRDR